MPLKKTTEILTQHQVDSFNRITDSLFAEIEANKIKSEKYQEWQDSMNKLNTTTLLVDTDKNWYMQAQGYVVPSFIAVIIMGVIFGFLVIIDSNRAQKENKKNKKNLLDSLNNEN
jgi:maltodextrin utilization protein YvdJ